MSLDLARTRAALTSEVAALEKLLEHEPGWLALRDFEARAGKLSLTPTDHGPATSLPDDLRDALTRNPLFLARASLLEALASLPDNEGERDDAAEPQCELQPELQFEPEPTPASPASPAERIDVALSALVSRARALPAPDLTPDPSSVPAARAPSPTRIPIVDETCDDLRHIAFIDDEVAGRLNASGILRFSDIAHLTVDQVALISVRFGLGNRISREQWVEQATILAGGRSTAYARQVQSGKVGSEPATPLPRASDPASDTDLPGEPPSGIIPPVPPPSLAPPFAETIQPPPLPEHSFRHTSGPAHYEHGAGGYAEHADAQVRFVARLRERPRAGIFASNPVKHFQQRWARDDRPLSRNSTHWETAEEAAVEIVARAPPFPGVGPVEEAARRLQSAAEMPESTLSGILKALRRR